MSKVINVTTNDPDKPQLVLALNADITPIIRFDTPTPNVIALNDKTDTVQDLGIHVSEKEKAEISRIVCSPSYVSGKLEKTSDHGDYKVTLTVGANAPVGRSNITVVAFSTSAREPQSSTQMICEKGIVVTPPSMYLGSITAQTQMPLTQQVVVRRREGAFKITGIDNDDPKLEIKQEMLPDSLGYRLAITYAGGWPKGFISRTLTIHTDDPLQPTFRVTVVAQVLVGK